MNKQIIINGQENINETLSIHYIIYRIDNIKNGKYYVGQHKTENPLDDYMGSGLLIENAIKKYNIDNFIKTTYFQFSQSSHVFVFTLRIILKFNTLYIKLTFLYLLF